MVSSPDTPARTPLIYVLLILLIWAFSPALVPQALAFPQAEVTLGAGESLWLRFGKDISSGTAQIGERVEAELEGPRAAKGTRVIGTVAVARAASKSQRIPGRLKLAFSQIVLPDGHTIPMDGTIEVNGWGMPNQGWKSDASAVAGMAAGMATLGALIGIAKGAKGAGIGAGIGAAVGLVLAGWTTKAGWKDVVISKRHLAAVALKQDVRIPVAPPSKH